MRMDRAHAACAVVVRIPPTPCLCACRVRRIRAHTAYAWLCAWSVRLPRAHAVCGRPVCPACARISCASRMRTILRTTNAHNAPVLRATGGFNLGGMWSPPATQDVRRAVNVGVSSELLADARRAGVNLSALLRRALTAELQQLRSRQWREESAEAIAAYNAQLMLHGACFQGRWGD